MSLEVGDLASGASVQVSAIITPPEAGGNVAATGEVAATQPDPNAANNIAAASADVSSGTLVVTNTSDTGAGSLRQAIDDANGNPGLDIITFNIPGKACQKSNQSDACQSCATNW